MELKMLLKCVASYLVIYLFVIVNIVESGRIGDKYCDKSTGRIKKIKLINGVEQHKNTRQCCEGFVHKNQKCIPNCDVDCENGKCIGNNICECIKGYKILSPRRCIPECSKCDYGNCIAPEKCDCYHGYEKSDNGTCVPQCTPPCVNAECISPNKCQCNGSFKFINNTHCVSDNFLQKQDMCVKACDNGSCDGFQKCNCNAGYESHNESCKKTCDKECINGKCLDDQCVCNDEFVTFNATNCVTKEFIIQSDLCKAICKNGKCSDSNECLCYDGFKFNKEQNKCVPACSFECIHGKCVTPNECDCLNGYEKVSEFQCNPVCENCSNGYCKEPGVCECNKGFILEASGCNEEDNIEVELDLKRILKTASGPDYSSQSSVTMFDDKVSTIDENVDEIESKTISSFVPIPSTEVINIFVTDESYQKIKTTTSSFDTSKIDESFVSTTETVERTNTIEIDKILTNQKEKVRQTTTSYDTSFAETSTATNNDETNDPKIDSSLSDTIKSSTDASYLNTLVTISQESSSDILFLNIDDKLSTTTSLLMNNSSEVTDTIQSSTDASENSSTDGSELISQESSSDRLGIDDKLSTTPSLFMENSSEVTDTIQSSTDASEKSSTDASKVICRESLSNRHNIDDKLSTTPLLLMKNSSELADVSKPKTDAKVEKIKPLNSCEKPCDNGDCPTDGECKNKLNTLSCNCTNGICSNNNCTCNPGFIISSEDISMCIKEVQVTLVSEPSEASKQSSLSPLYWIVLALLVLVCLFIIIIIFYKLRGHGKSYFIESQELSENCAYYVKAHNVDGSSKC